MPDRLSTKFGFELETAPADDKEHLYRWMPSFFGGYFGDCFAGCFGGV